METERTAVVTPLLHDLQRIFSTRLEALVAYGWRARDPVPTLALVQSLTFDDLNACAARAAEWRRRGAATPLLLTRAEFARSLDAFPIEYGEIIANHHVVFGRDPFEGLRIETDDLRRACEVQVKSHLLHLREDYVESGGHHREVDGIVRDSAPGFVALLRLLVRLEGTTATSQADLLAHAEQRVGLDPHVAGDLLALADGQGPAAVDTVKLFPSYLEAMERLAEFVDRWHAR